MKKLLRSLVAVLFVLAIAASPIYAGGSFYVDSSADGSGVDADLQYIPNGVAGGMSGADGSAGSYAVGGIYNGTVEGFVDSWAGGVTNTQAYVFNPGVGDIGIGVGSYSENIAVTGASTDIGVSGFIGGAYSEVEGSVAQGTINGSTLGESPYFFSNTVGRTGGIAGQGSVGGFDGSAFVGTFYGEAEAGVEAEVSMTGSSYSDSYRFVDWEYGSKTEGMGTVVGANTNVTSYGDSYDSKSGWAYGSAHVSGGWMAIGGAATKTVQMSSTGLAVASATGRYSGHGSLNTDYTGSANGYSQTQITSFDGMNGSIVRSSAGMSVTSRTIYNQ